MVRVTVRDIRQAGLEVGWGLLCVTGLHTLFESYGLNWDSVVQNGMTVEEAQMFDNDVGRRAIEIAKERESGQE